MKFKISSTSYFHLAKFRCHLMCFRLRQKKFTWNCFHIFMVEKVKNCAHKIHFTQQPNGLFTWLTLQINWFLIKNNIKKKRGKKTRKKTNLMMFLSAFFGGCEDENLLTNEGVHGVTPKWRNKPVVVAMSGLRIGSFFPIKAKRRDPHLFRGLNRPWHVWHPSLEIHAFVAKQLNRNDRLNFVWHGWGVNRINGGVVKALGFDNVFSSALTGRGAAVGGADIDPLDKSESEMQRFCQSLHGIGQVRRSWHGSTNHGNGRPKWDIRQYKRLFAWKKFLVGQKIGTRFTTNLEKQIYRHKEVKTAA